MHAVSLTSFWNNKELPPEHTLSQETVSNVDTCFEFDLHIGFCPNCTVPSLPSKAHDMPAIHTSILYMVWTKMKPYD